MMKVGKIRDVNMSIVERDVLKAVQLYGRLGPTDQEQDTALGWLAKRYDMSDHATSQLLTCVSDYLVEQRYLWPYFSSEGGQIVQARVRGITPKGIERLRELDHPVRTWVGRNWFPVVVAAIASTVALGDLALRIALAL